MGMDGAMNDDPTGRIVQTDGILGGQPRVDGTRIGVHHIVDLVLHGKYTVGDVVYEVYPDLTTDDVEAAIRYHLRNKRAHEDAAERLAGARRLIEMAGTGTADDDYERAVTDAMGIEDEENDV